MPSYVPNNIAIFSAAYAGALMGIATGSATPVDPTPVDDSPAVLYGAAWAVAVDTAWVLDATPTDFEVFAIVSASSNFWAARSVFAPIGAAVLPATYEIPATGVCAEVLAGNDWLASQSIVSPPFGGGGGGGGMAPYQVIAWYTTFPADYVFLAPQTTAVWIDGGNETVVNQGAPYAGSGATTGVIFNSLGNNPQPAAMSQWFNSFRNRPYSRGDVISSQFSQVGSGIIYAISRDPGSIAALLVVALTSTAGFGQPSSGSWLVVLDCANPGSPTTLYAYNPGSVAAPSFTIDGSGIVTATFADASHDWAVTTYATMLGVAGSL